MLARLRLIWVTMYPLPRILITAALFVAIGYGLVALFFSTPARDGYAAWVWGIPAVVFVVLAFFPRGEPSDQTTVHWPKMSDEEFEALEDEVDGVAQGSYLPEHADALTFDPAHNEQDFIELVRQAIDELPPEFAQALDHVGVVISDQGAVQRLNGRLQPLYGLYVGYGGRSSYIIGAPVSYALPDRIVIFRDTLVHDYGNDPDRLRMQVTRTLRHELAHHLGWDETGVRSLGL
jgi:predicted Zn-dependent protease with MMP-like domain